jgi:hypothetical protein
MTGLAGPKKVCECGAPITWAQTVSGAWIAVDEGYHPDGNLVHAHEWRWTDDGRRVNVFRVVPAGRGMRRRHSCPGHP